MPHGHGPPAVGVVVTPCAPQGGAGSSGRIGSGPQSEVGRSHGI